jgi:hypothetical protein
MACEKYDILPKEPADFYKDFTNIPNELGFNKNRKINSFNYYHSL